MRREYKWRLKNPEKARATKILRNAVRHGRIIKPKECQRCGAVARLCGHHEDYSKPLDVIYVCWICHKKIHEKPYSQRNITFRRTLVLWILKWLRKNNVCQNKLAKEVGVTETTINYLLNGRRNVSQETAERIMKVTGFTH